MPPPPRQECSVLECQYSTPEGVPTWEMLTTHLSTHAQSAHAPPAAVQQQPRQHTHNAKLESLPRPKFILNMTEAQWEFTNMQWEAYIAQTPASDIQKLQQLRAACDKDLLQRVYDCGTFNSLDTTALLISKMKELSVITIHKTILMLQL